MADKVPASRPGKTYEMQWDCKFCGSTKLLGKTHRFCPNCGSQQDPSWRYFPSDEEKVAVEDHVYVGADKVCPACSSLSAASAEHCGNCGSPLSGAKQAQSGAQREGGQSDQFQTENLKDKQQAATTPLKPQTAPAKSGTNWKVIAVVVGIVVLVGGAIFALTRTRDAAVYVTGFRWERAIQLEALQAVSGSGDCNSVPVDAYGTTRNYEQTGSRQVPDGETCRRVQVDQGDGTFREEEQCETNYRSEPVYGYVCYYTVNRWVSARALTTQGDKSDAPEWSAERVRTGSCLGCERESGRNEQYWLVLRGEGDRTFECAVPFDTWETTTMERGFTLQVGAVLGNPRCDTLQPVS